MLLLKVINTMWDKNKDFEAGINFKKKHNYVEAFKSFDRVREQNPEIPQYWHCAGHMLLLTGDKSKGENYLNKAAELYDKEDHEECFWTGAVYALLNNKENSLKFLKRAIRLDNFFNTYREEALTEEDYSVFYDDPDFIELTRNRLSEEIEKEFSNFYLKKMKEENIIFKKIDKSEFDFYLGVPFFKKLFISQSKAQNLELFFKDYYLKPIEDSKGNITDIKAPADMWQTELFEDLAGFIKEGSYILFVDDTEKFWKAEFHKGKVEYFIQN